MNEKCAYDTVSLRLCANYGATAKVGWEWQQEYYSLVNALETKSYTIKLDFYL